MGPGPGADHVYTMNPIKEFVENHEAHVRDTFEQFKVHHDKKYRDENDEESRLDVYRQNLRYIHSKNRKGLTYTLASNHLADMTNSEMMVLRGRIHDSNLKTNGGQAHKYSKAEVKDAPDVLDWRLYGAVTPVKDQSGCGSVGTLEGTLFLHTGNLVRLSQQALVDCSWGFGNNGCDGGEDFRAYQWMIKHGGIPTEASYGPYLGQDGYCNLNKSTMGLKIKGWVNVTSGDLDGLKVALLAVGYGEILGMKYWLVKNSWSTYWGNDGYVLMAQKDNNCGVATAATYVIPDMS